MLDIKTPACPACSCRAVNTIFKEPEPGPEHHQPRDYAEAVEMANNLDWVPVYQRRKLEVVYNCRDCGRDQTAAWRDVLQGRQPKYSPPNVVAGLKELARFVKASGGW